MEYSMRLTGMLIAYKLPLEEAISNGKGGFQNFKWITINMSFDFSTKESDKLIRKSTERFLQKLNEGFEIVVSEILDGGVMPSEVFKIGEYI